MVRNLALGALLAAALGLVGAFGPSARADDKDKEEAAHSHRHFAKCAKVCAECMQHCEMNFHHCAELVASGKKEHAPSMHLSADCAELCATSAKLSARHSPLAIPACEACAKACDLCAAACEKHADDDLMKACAKACRDCAKECRTMVKHLGHDHGKEGGK